MFLILILTTMPSRPLEADLGDDEGDENIDQELQKNQLSTSLALG